MYTKVTDWFDGKKSKFEARVLNRSEQLIMHAFHVCTIILRQC